MTIEAAANTIRSRFATQYHASRTEPIAFDNLAQLRKQDGSLIDAPQDANGDPIAWVRLSIRHGSAFQVTLGRSGSRVWRHPGVVMVQIFTVAGTGDGLAHRIADDIAAVFRGITVSGVRFKATSAPQFAGPDGAWWQTNCVTPFEFDLSA